MIPPTAPGPASRSREVLVRRVQLAIGVSGAGLLLVLVLLVGPRVIAQDLGFELVLAVVAMWLVAPFRIELSTGIGTVTVGVWAGVLSFLLSESSAPQAVVVWVLGLAVTQIIARRRLWQAVYYIGLATFAGGAFALVIGLFPEEGWTQFVAIVPAVVVFVLISVGTEFMLARVALRDAVGSVGVRLRPRRVALALVVNVLICLAAPVVTISLAVREIPVGDGVHIRWMLSLLLVALIVLSAGQYLRRRRVERKLAGLIGGALALPWGDAPAIFEALEDAARKSIPVASTRVSEEPGRVFELTAEVHVPGGSSRYIVLTRRPGAGGFSALEQSALRALAHIASQALYDRRHATALRTAATTDSLTGMSNSLGLFEAFNSGLRSGLVAVYMDLDNFKEINDEFGHQAGDEVLSIVGARIRGCLRADDIAARLGGDEFVVIIEQSTASRIAARIRAAVEQSLVVNEGAVAPRISIGAPVSIEGGDLDAALRNADRSMYAVKRARQGMTGSSTLRDLSMEVRNAITSNRVEVAFQPIVDIVADEILGFEALARYTTRDGVPVPPRDLVRIASISGLLDVFTEQILIKSTQHMTEFQAIEQRLSLLNINIEAGQLTRDEIADVAKAAHRAHPNIELCLEITETSAGHIQEMSSKSHDRIRDLIGNGVAVALDDYGQDHAGPAALLTTPTNQLKVDQSFLADEHNLRCSLILQSTLELVDRLGMDAIVEGVEMPWAHDVLLSLDARRAQGFLYGRPLSPKEVQDRLRTTGIIARSTP